MKMTLSSRSVCHITKAQVSAIANSKGGIITIEQFRESRQLLQFFTEPACKYNRPRLRKAATSPLREFTPCADSTSGCTLGRENVINRECKIRQYRHRESLRTQNFLAHVNTTNIRTPLLAPRKVNRHWAGTYLPFTLHVVNGPGHSVSVESCILDLTKLLVAPPR
jgi:hypothetical protein